MAKIYAITHSAPTPFLFAPTDLRVYVVAQTLEEALAAWRSAKGYKERAEPDKIEVLGPAIVAAREVNLPPKPPPKPPGRRREVA